jgi:ABC-2 type transport system permease protein
MIQASITIFKAYWQIILTYRGMMLIQAVRILLLPVVLLSAWLSIEKAPGNPYENADYLLYYLMVPLILNITDSRTIFRFTQAIRDGSLSRDLLKPYPAAAMFIIETIAGNAVQLIYLLPLTMTGFIIWRDSLPQLNFSLSAAALFFAALIAGALLRMLIAGTISLLGFWIENVTTLNLVINGGIWALLGGMIVPVATFPPGIRTIAGYLPYRYMLSFPIEVLSGRLSALELKTGFYVAIFWTFFFLLLSRLIWKIGLKSYTAYGG